MPLPGRMMMSTPMNPPATASQRAVSTFSFRKNTAISVTSTGAMKVIDEVSASGICLIANTKNRVEPASIRPRTSCTPRRCVRTRPETQARAEHDQHQQQVEEVARPDDRRHRVEARTDIWTWCP